MEKVVIERFGDGLTETEAQNILTELVGIIPFDSRSLATLRDQITTKASVDEIVEFFDTVFNDTYKLREDSLSSAIMRDIELYVFLSSIDEQWMDHLDNMTNLRDAIWLRGSKEQALAEYKREAFKLFQEMVARVELESLRKVFRIQLQPAEPQPPTNLVMSGPAESLPSLVEEDEPNQGTTSANTPSKPKKAKKSKKKRGSYL